MLNRRQVLSCGAAVAGGALVRPSLAQVSRLEQRSTTQRPLVVSTWPFGKDANEAAVKTIERGGTALDAVEQGIRLTEASGNSSVGLTGRPNAAGYVQLDACIIDGPGQRAGSVSALEGIRYPISVARRVMEKTPHVMLSGQGARWFALQEGFESVDMTQVEHQKQQWLNRPARSPSSSPADNHDTIALLVLAPDGTIAGGCSTSGLADKLPGRVGDSPIVGSGLFVDNQVGAAGATGVGENVMRYCATFLIVEFMRQGLHPTAACQKAIDRIAATDPRGRKLDIHFVALDKQGRFGAAATNDFPYSVTYPGFSQVIQVPA